MEDFVGEKSLECFPKASNIYGASSKGVNGDNLANWWRKDKLALYCGGIILRVFLQWKTCLAEQWEREREKERLWQEFIIILCQWRNLANIVRRSWNFPPSVSGDAIQKLIFKIFVLLQILEKRKFLLTMNAVDEVIYYIFIARKPTENPFFTIGFRWHSTDQAALKD